MIRYPTNNQNDAILNHGVRKLPTLKWFSPNLCHSNLIEVPSPLVVDPMETIGIPDCIRDFYMENIATNIGSTNTKGG